MTFAQAGVTFDGTPAMSVTIVETFAPMNAKGAPMFAIFVQIRRKVIQKLDCVRIGERLPETRVISAATGVT